MKQFIIVTGLPASGKSTVGAAVAAALGLPLIDKDVILEGLFDRLGAGDVTWRTRLSRAADEVLQRQALHSPGGVIASWWRHPLSQVESGTSPGWLASLPGAVTELHCRCSPQVAVERFFARRRHAGHLDGSKSRAEQLANFVLFDSHGALGLGRVVEINTEERLELREVLRELELSRPKYAIAEIERRWLVNPAALDGLIQGQHYREIEDLYVAETQLRLRRVTGADDEVVYKFCKKYSKGADLSEPAPTCTCRKIEFGSEAEAQYIPPPFVGEEIIHNVAYCGAALALRPEPN